MKTGSGVRLFYVKRVDCVREGVTEQTGGKSAVGVSADGKTPLEQGSGFIPSRPGSCRGCAAALQVSLCPLAGTGERDLWSMAAASGSPVHQRALPRGCVREGVSGKTELAASGSAALTVGGLFRVAAAAPLEVPPLERSPSVRPAASTLPFQGRGRGSASLLHTAWGGRRPGLRGRARGGGCSLGAVPGSPPRRRDIVTAPGPDAPDRGHDCARPSAGRSGRSGEDGPPNPARVRCVKTSRHRSRGGLRAAPRQAGQNRAASPQGRLRSYAHAEERTSGRSVGLSLHCTSAWPPCAAVRLRARPSRRKW
ncbi:PREDICTED: uncharacterized protein LOC106146894 [Chinchilla lanigera]|uniref:uncharacterized protein LOC106146894 n=1 Tax=Chinchilla lanigera TaxID=34839 RepID=UPI000698D7B4|nr:PREDICTED: uncharacterized protein LOC106146894 [Chinchilla lanigera]